MTYKEVAKAAGRQNAYRAVGNILNTNYDPKIPCHRVVRSDGQTGGWNRGAETKSLLLRKERVKDARNNRMVRKDLQNNKKRGIWVL